MERVATKWFGFGAKEMAASEAVQLFGRVGILGSYNQDGDSLESEYEHDNTFSFISQSPDTLTEILRRNHL